MSPYRREQSCCSTSRRRTRNREPRRAGPAKCSTRTSTGASPPAGPGRFRRIPAADTTPARTNVLHRRSLKNVNYRSKDTGFGDNYRLYPTPGQRAALARAFGCARVVFNDGLYALQQARAAGFPYITDAESSARLTAAKATPERAWLGEVSAVVLQQALADLTTAYRNFFASVKGTRKGPKVGPPRFRSRKDHRQAIRFTRNARFSVTLGGKLQTAHDRGHSRAVVMQAAVGAVVGRRDHGFGRSVLRQLRR